MKMTLNQKILSGFIVCTVIMVAVAFFSFRNSEKFIDTNKLVNHTHEVLNEFEQVLSSSSDAQTGMRGFVISGKEAFLDTYNNARKQIFVHLEKVKKFTEDNPAQQKNIDNLKEQVDIIIKFNTQVIDIRKTDFEKAKEIVTSGRGEQIQNEIRRIVADCKDIENKLLDERKKASEEDARSFNTIFIILLIIIAAVLISVYLIVTANLLAIKKAEQESADKNWILTGNFELNEKIRGEKEAGELAQIVIEQLCTYLNARIGVIYLFENGQLNLSGSYAFYFRKHNTNVIKLGEGLVGQAALEKKPIVFTEVPVEYIKINSGLGNIIPKNIIMYPFLQDGVLKGVIEIGTAKEFSDLEMEFLKMIGENIAIVITAAQSRTKLKEHLEEKQRQTEELETQQEALLENTSLLEKSKTELKAQKEELLQTNEKLEEKANELNIANQELIFQNDEKEKRVEELKIANIDIVEGKRVEAVLEIAKKAAEDANKMKSLFLANMSHEIRTPLNAIVGFSSILKERSQDNKVNSEYLDNIIQSSNVLLNLINDILDLSKVEAGRMVIDNQALNLNNLIKEIQTVFIMKATEKGILINIQIADNIPGSLITDEKFLRQILFNLIGNAVKFTNTGSVDIIIDIIPKNEEGSKIDMLISIKDSGIGIPAKQLTSIFEPFIQLENKSSNKYGGTGLGLSITKRLIELLGGTLSVESEYGKGSVFSVSLFNIEIGTLNTNDSEKNIDKNWLKNIRFKNPLLLIAEDVLSNRQVLKGYLETLNITIIETENGEDCISAARKNRPDIILMDMQMPVMDGYTAVNILKLDKDLKNIPIIALTASGMKHEKDKFGSVADDFLLKPIYKYELVELLTKYLPYEQLIEIEKTVESFVDIPTSVISQDKLPIEIKSELINKFIPTITKLQKTLNFDDLIEFGKELEAFMIKHNNTQVTDYCIQLNESIATFNTDKIYATLLQLSNFINK